MHRHCPQWITLKAQLDAFASELDRVLLPTTNGDGVTNPEDEEEDATVAQRFWKEQQDRLWSVEQRLLQVSQTISRNTTSTTAQKAAVCLERCQELQTKQLQCLFQRHSLFIPAQLQHAVRYNHNSSNHHYLDPVTEVDRETDGTVTPCSSSSSPTGAVVCSTSQTQSLSSSSNSSSSPQESKHQHQHWSSDSGSNVNKTSPVQSQSKAHDDLLRANFAKASMDDNYNTSRFRPHLVEDSNSNLCFDTTSRTVETAGTLISKHDFSATANAGQQNDLDPRLFHSTPQQAPYNSSENNRHVSFVDKEEVEDDHGFDDRSSSTSVAPTVANPACQLELQQRHGRIDFAHEIQLPSSTRDPSVATIPNKIDPVKSNDNDDSSLDESFKPVDSEANTRVNPKLAADSTQQLYHDRRGATQVDEDEPSSVQSARTKVNPRCAVEQAAWQMEHKRENHLRDADSMNSTSSRPPIPSTKLVSSPWNRHREQASYSTPSNRGRPHSIEFDTNAPSPANTNITFDLSMDDAATVNTLYLNDTLQLQPLLETVLEESVGTSINQHNNDNSVISTDTPVLERYRLVDDDESPHGFTVLPNERGQHHRPPSSPVKSTTSRAAAPQYASPLHDNQQNEVTAGFEKKVYRKTPRPKPKPEKSPRSVPYSGENELDENLSHADNDYFTASLERSAVSHTPPLASSTFSHWRRPLSEGNHRTEDLLRRLVALDQRYGDRSAMGDQVHSSLTPPTTSTHTTLQNHQQHTHSNESPSRLPPFQESTGPMIDTAPTASSHLPYLRPISESEFKSAPFRVRLLVSHAQVDAAVNALNHAIRQALVTSASSSPNCQPPQRVHVAETEVHAIWQALSSVEWNLRQRQSLLAALCHFGRLQLRNSKAQEHGDEEQEAVYDVVG